MEDVTSSGSGAAGLATRAARWTIALAWAMGLCSGLLSGFLSTGTPVVWLGYALALLGTFLLTDPRDAPLTLWRALAVVACSVAIAVIVLAQRPTGAVYLFDFASFLVALLIARGNARQGVLGGALMVLAAVAWGWATGAQPTAVAALISLAVMAQVLGPLWRLVLRWIVGRVRGHRSASAAAERITQAALQADRLRVIELNQVRAMAEPVLREIAAGVPLTGELRRRIAIVEGALRDRLRAPAFQQPVLIDAVASLRADETDVTVISPDDMDVIDGDLAAVIAATLTAGALRVVLRATVSGDRVHVTLRQDDRSDDFYTGSPIPTDVRTP